MSQFDTVLKEIIRSSRSVLVEELAGGRVIEWLDVELPRTRNPRVDLLGRLENGRVWHLELQSKNDNDMDWRALEYYALIGSQIKEPPIQVTLYVGDPPLRMQGRMDHESLSFRHRIVDIREFDAEHLLASADPGDALLSILCRVNDKREAVRRILRRIAAMEGPRRSDALTRLLVLSGLRGATALVIEESKTMPVVIDPMENPVFKEWYEEARAKGHAEGHAEGRQEGRQEGRAEGHEQGHEQGREQVLEWVLRNQLERRFADLPPWVEQRLVTSSVREREAWALRVVDAMTIEDVFRGD